MYIFNMPYVLGEEHCRSYVVGEFSPIPVVAELENRHVGGWKSGP